MKKILNKYPEKLFFLFLFFIIGFLVYGYQIHRMGFYWDDWMSLLISKIGNQDIFFSYYKYDRPFSIWTYLFTYPLLNHNPNLWQLFTIFIRVLGAFGIFLVIKEIWPNQTKIAFWTSAIWIVFPGFKQQAISIAYSQHFLTFLLFIFSLYFFALGVRKEKYIFVILSFLFCSLSMVTMEYFIGLEILRPLTLIFILWGLGSPWKKIAKQLFLYWGIYFPAYFGFLYYRFIWLNTLVNGKVANTPVILNEIRVNPLSGGIHLVQNSVNDIINLIFFDWLNPLKPSEIVLTAKSFWFSIFLSFVVAGLIFVLLFFRFNQGHLAEKDDKRIFIQGIIFSISALLFGGLPVWITGETIINGLWSDRFALAPMVGSIFLILLLIHHFVEDKNKFLILVSVLFISASIFQMQNVNEFRNNWIKQEDFYSQLLFRIPAIKENTAILMTTMPFDKAAEYSIANAINILYGDEIQDENLPYYFFSAMNRKDSHLANFLPNQDYQYQIRSLNYSGNTSNSIVFKKVSENSCYVLMNQRDIWLPDLQPFEADLISLSNSERILFSSDEISSEYSEIFGQHDQNNWCSFFQQADLAAQEGDWDQVLRIKTEATDQGYYPSNGRELYPYLLAELNTNQFDDFQQDAKHALELTPDLDQFMCSFLREIQNNESLSQDERGIVDNLSSEFGCYRYN